jgi:hypothetical protein
MAPLQARFRFPSEAGAERPPDLRAGAPAWLMSCGLHVVLAVTLGVLLQAPPPGNSGQPERPGGIVLVSRAQQRTEYLSESDLDSSSAAAASARDASETSPTQALPSADRPPLDLRGALPDPGSATAAAPLSALPSAGDFAAGGGGPGTTKDWGAYAVRTKVFGVEGTGSRFIYVFDRSGSMEGFEGRPLAAAKRELLNSLRDLQSTHQFQIIFYNERPFVFNPHHPQAARMLFGDDPTKRLAERFVQGVVGDGGTRHLEALKMAIGLGPDVIFFLTDAAEPALTHSQLDEIRRLNGRVGASINTIEFGTGSSTGEQNFLVRLARENGGRHTYVDLNQLSLAP